MRLFMVILMGMTLVACERSQPIAPVVIQRAPDPDPDPNTIHRVIQPPGVFRNVPRPIPLAPVDVVDRILTEIYQDASHMTGTMLFTLDDPTSNAEITGELKRGTSAWGESRHYITVAGGLQFSSKQAMLDAIVAATPYRCEVNPERGVCARMLGWDLVPNSAPWASFSGRVEGKWR